MITVHHNAIGGVTSASRRFIHYTRWPDTISYPLLMMGDNLPRTLQTALSNTFGAPRGATFESRMGLDPSMEISFLSSSSEGCRIPVFSGDAIGPDFSIISYRERHIWVRAHSVFSRSPVLHQVKTSELMAIWDYKGKLESRGWSREQSLRILKARLLSPPGKMLRCFGQAVFSSNYISVLRNRLRLKFGHLPGD
jgi:hypothetical protein